MTAPSSPVPAVEAFTPTQDPQIDPQALPCPFCGSPAETELWHGGAPTKTRVVCSSYDCSVRPSSCEETYNRALAIWNNRTPTPGRAAEPDTMGEVERLVQALLRGQRGWERACETGPTSLAIERRRLFVEGEEALLSAVRTIATERDDARMALAASEDERCKMADTILRWQADSNDEVDAERTRAETAEAQLATLRAEVEGLKVEWRPMSTAPRDGTPILIAFGSDCTSSAIYSRNDDDRHPWKFIDTQGPGLPIFNGARDDRYGPTGWMPLPKWTPLLSTSGADR